IVDDELRWFFSKHDGVWASPYHAEMEAQREPWLPDTDDGEAIAVYWQIRKRLGRIGDPDAGVLSAAYAPRPWPRALRAELGRVTGIVVRLASADSGEWPEERNAQDVLDVRVARRLEVALCNGGREVLDAYRTPALVRLSRALSAYRTAGRR
ncbi:MAG: hypothetical protein ACRELB_02240, partial [Polyangiaceae bacterium]